MGINIPLHLQMIFDEYAYSSSTTSYLKDISIFYSTGRCSTVRAIYSSFFFFVNESNCIVLISGDGELMTIQVKFFYEYVYHFLL